MRYKKTIITPGYNPKYLEILLQNLLLRREEFDNWDIWANTYNRESLFFLESLSKQYSFIYIQYSEEPIIGYPTLSHYWRKYIDENTLYLRLDEDIVYIHPGSLTRLFEARLQHPAPFLIFGNIVNNALINFKLQEKGLINYPNGKITYNCFDRVSTQDPEFLHYIHRLFLGKKDKKKLEDFFLENTILNDYERFSINTFCVFGSDLKQFGGVVEGEEEPFLSSIKPSQISRPNMILGDTLFVHFAFHTQRREDEKEHFLLQQYKNQVI